LVKLGGVVAEAAAASGKKVVFVASCDHGHARVAGGPYGYDPAAAVYDKLVRDMVKADRLEDLLGIDPGLVEAGKPDSLWQMLVLLGVLRRQVAVRHLRAAGVAGARSRRPDRAGRGPV